MTIVLWEALPGVSGWPHISHDLVVGGRLRRARERAYLSQILVDRLTLACPGGQDERDHTVWRAPPLFWSCNGNGGNYSLTLRRTSRIRSASDLAGRATQIILPRH
jgi:hypothetical protein